MRASAINTGNKLDIFSSVTFRLKLSYEAFFVLNFVYYIPCIRVHRKVVCNLSAGNDGAMEVLLRADLHVHA